MAKRSIPIGQRLTLTFQPHDGEPSREIVGLVADTLPFRGASEVPPLIYLLHRQQARGSAPRSRAGAPVMSFIVRTTGDPLALSGARRAARRQVDVTTPVASIRTVESYLNAGRRRCCSLPARSSACSRLLRAGHRRRRTYALQFYGVTQRSTAPTLVSPAVRGRPHRRAVGPRLAALGTRHRVVSHEPHGHAIRSRCRSSSPAAVLLATALARVSFPRCGREASR
jgi:hypothetical protein